MLLRSPDSPEDTSEERRASVIMNDIYARVLMNCLLPLMSTTFLILTTINSIFYNCEYNIHKYIFYKVHIRTSNQVLLWLNGT